MAPVFSMVAIKSRKQHAAIVKLAEMHNRQRTSHRRRDCFQMSVQLPEGEKYPDGVSKRCQASCQEEGTEIKFSQNSIHVIRSPAHIFGVNSIFVAYFATVSGQFVAILPLIWCQ